eukprot:UN10209
MVDQICFDKVKTLFIGKWMLVMLVISL